MSQVKICDKVIDNPRHEFLVKAMEEVSYGKGVSYFDFRKNRYVDHSELFFTGQCLNQSLLVTTLAQRIAAGDIELVEKGDSIGKKEYYEKLLKSVENDFNKFG